MSRHCGCLGNLGKWEQKVTTYIGQSFLLSYREGSNYFYKEQIIISFAIARQVSTDNEKHFPDYYSSIENSKLTISWLCTLRARLQ